MEHRSEKKPRRRTADRLTVAAERIGQSMTVAEAAAKAQVHVETMRRWIRDGQLSAFRYANKLRIDPASLAQFLENVEKGK